ncbi:MAG: rhodanese-like domain-containing protein [Bacillota bacterium]
MNQVLIQGKDRWVLAFVVVLVGVMIAAIAQTIAAGREGIVRRDAWTETAQGLVQALLAGEEVQVVDARSAAAYEGGHVRGALSLPAASLVDEAFGAARLWPEIIAAVARAGVDPERPTVVYAADPKDAAYVVWALRAAGLADVKLLAGGVMALLEAGAPVETGPADARPRSVDDYPGRQAPAKEIAVDLAGLYGGRGNPVQLVDTRAAAAEAIHLAGAATHVVEGNALVHGDGVKRSRLAVNKALRPLGSETAVVYGDDVRDAALVWWGLASEGKKAQLFMDGFALWQASGLPTQAVDRAPAAAQPSGMRVGGGCG